MRITLPTEHDEQCALIIWAKANAGRYPNLVRLHAIPNAGAGAQRGQAGKMKAEGVKPGVPDLSLPVPIGRYHGAYIEMKRVRGSSTSPEQVEWGKYLQFAGYAYCLACGFEEARAFLVRYLEGRA